jgi:lysozyme
MEGLKLKSYKDGADHRTIGYGHMIRPWEDLTEITKEQAEDLLHRDVMDAESAIRSMISVPLTQNQFDALVCFFFNVNPSKFRNTATHQLLNDGNYDVVPSRLLLWNKINVGGVMQESKGLTRRRLHEIALWKGTLTHETQIDHLPT